MQTTTPFKLIANHKLKWISDAGEHVLGLKKLEKYYRQRRENMDTQEFLRYTLETLNIRYTLASGDVNNIPQQGAVMVVANHPFGAIEGVVLAELLLQQRGDVKILANRFLQRIEELSGLFIGVDVLGGDGKSSGNMTALRKAMSHLSEGGVLLVFPAGEVSSWDMRSKQITDRHWNRLIGMMARKTAAQCLPIYIEGQNSPLFHAAGLAHPRLRTLLLAREMLNKRNRSMRLHIGEAIAPAELKNLASDTAITHYLRLNTYLLATRTQASAQKTADKNIIMRPIMNQVDASDVARNVAALDAERLLLMTDQFDVYCATAQELPHVLPEIGRLREVTFRSVGEGTGLACDLDNYDRYYQHLFVWDRQNRVIAGAYRLGLVDKITAQQGVKGLYSRSLFSYGRNFVASLDNAIEMGRSFVCVDYQRSLNVLMLLWKGIATFVARHPHYTTLFGPVSISNDYSELSRSLIASYLQLHFYDERLAGMIRPTNMLKKSARAFWTRNMLAELEDEQLLSRLVQRMEGDKGLPVLVRQYLNLNGRLVCFNVDREFNNTLDGMIIVDLRNVEERVLGRYMGKEAAKEYLRQHVSSEQAA